MQERVVGVEIKSPVTSERLQWTKSRTRKGGMSLMEVKEERAW